MKIIVTYFVLVLGWSAAFAQSADPIAPVVESFRIGKPVAEILRDLPVGFANPPAGEKKDWIEQNLRKIYGYGKTVKIDVTSPKADVMTGKTFYSAHIQDGGKNKNSFIVVAYETSERETGLHNLDGSAFFRSKKLGDVLGLSPERIFRGATEASGESPMYIVWRSSGTSAILKSKPDWVTRPVVANRIAQTVARIHRTPSFMQYADFSAEQLRWITAEGAAVEGRALASLNSKRIVEFLQDEQWRNRLAHGDLRLVHLALTDRGSIVVGGLHNVDQSHHPLSDLKTVIRDVPPPLRKGFVFPFVKEYAKEMKLKLADAKTLLAVAQIWAAN